MDGIRTERGQVLVMVALMITLLLAFAGLAIDVGRQVAEQRHIQTAADAAALAGCRALIAGDSDASAAAQARTIGEINLEHSPAAGSAVIAPDAARIYASGHAGDPMFLTSGIIVNGTTIRVAITSQVEAILARVVGVASLEAVGRSRCSLQGGPALPIVAKRYTAPPGPAGGFIDAVANAATSGNGAVDAISVLGYDGRTPATDADPGPIVELYGPGAKANNDNAFRGFVALDIRNFQSVFSRVYFNGVTAGTNPDTVKNKQGDYILTGYPGPGFPPISSPADPNDQIAVMEGNDSAMVLGNFATVYEPGDRLLLAVYNGTVMEIPDFAITPPSFIALPSTTSSPATGPTFTVARNDSFNSTVTLHLHGDHLSPYPPYDLIPGEPPSNAAPTVGHMNQPVWSTDVFIPSTSGTNVVMQSMSTNIVLPGIYTVWLEGHSGDPYFQTRRQPISVRIGGAVRDFSLTNSITFGEIASLGGSVGLPLFVSTTSAPHTRWGPSAGPVTLSVDAGSFTDCSFGAATINPGQLTISPATVTPSATGSGGPATLSINSLGLPPGCYAFTVRGTGFNASGEPVTHLLPITFTVATAPSSGQYVDVIGFAVFDLTTVDTNSISGRAVSPIVADPNDPALRRAQRARLVPW